jgi:hypothetical protein
MEVSLAQTGTYTAVIEDYGDTHAGTYTVSLLDISTGPYTSDSDPDGDAAGSPTTNHCSITPAPDFDCWYYFTSAGDTLRITAATTSGPVNTQISIYSPAGGAPVVSTTNDNVQYVCPTGGRYLWVVEDSSDNDAGTYDITFHGPWNASGVAPVETWDHTRVVVDAPCPNPFVSTATMAFSIPADLPVRLRVYDAGGRLVRTLADENLAAGRHRYVWDGRNNSGSEAASGVYYLALQAGRHAERRRLVRIR